MKFQRREKQVAEVLSNNLKIVLSENFEVTS